MYGSGQKRRGGLLHKKLSVIAEVAIIVSCLLVFALIRPVTVLGGMEPASAKMCFHMVTWITLVKSDCMDAGICSGIRTSCGGRRKIFYDHVVSGHVAVPILSVRDTDPISGIWTDGRLDRYVCRLDSACSNIYMEIP